MYNIQLILDMFGFLYFYYKENKYTESERKYYFYSIF